MSKLKIGILLLLGLLAGCKTDLYSDLSQEDANQMLALLMLHHIDATAETDAKGGKVKLTVEKAQFINAVELLRQNGLPKPHYVGVEELFPAGQLVSSPEQEQAKIAFLKEQQLERILSSMDGVISARVSIAEEPQTDDGKQSSKSASVYIKYSPESNFANNQSQLRGVIQNAVPGLDANKISLYLQASDYRYQPVVSAQKKQDPLSMLDQYRLPIVIALGVLGLLFFAGSLFSRRRAA